MATDRFQIASGSKSTMRFGPIIAGLILAIPIGFILFGLPHGPVTFTTSVDGLGIAGDPYGRTIPRSDLKVESARLIDLGADPAFALVRRTNGIALTGYQSGWFDTRGAGKALLFVSDRSRAVVVPTKLGYSLIVAPVNPELFLYDLKFPYAGPNAAHLLATADPDGGGVPPGLVALWAWVIVPPVAASALIVWLCARSRKVMFELTDESLRIRGDLYGRTIPRAALRLNEARLVDVTNGPDRLRLLRTNGIGLPGYRSGRYRAFGSGAYLLFVTDRTRVVRIPTTLGYTLLLSPAAPESFLRAIGAAG